MTRAESTEMSRAATILRSAAVCGKRGKRSATPLWILGTWPAPGPRLHNRLEASQSAVVAALCRRSPKAPHVLETELLQPSRSRTRQRLGVRRAASCVWSTSRSGSEPPEVRVSLQPFVPCLPAAAGPADTAALLWLRLCRADK